MDTTDALTLLKRFYKLQEERVETYALFDEGFKAYLAAAPNYNFPMFRQMVHEITETFKNISTEIMSIENGLTNECSRKEIAKLIGQVQDVEKQKLELTAQLQIAKQNCTDNPDDSAYQENVDDLQKRLMEAVEEINEHMEELKYESEDILT